MDPERLAADVRRNLRRLASIEESSVRRYVSVHRTTLKRLERNLTLLTNAIEKAEAAGERVNVAWLAQQERLTILLREFGEQTQEASRLLFTDLSEAAAEAGYDAVQSAITRAQVLSEGTAQAARISAAFAGIDSATIASVYGQLSSQATLSLFANIAGPAAEKMRNEFFYAVVSGQSVQETARNVRAMARIPLARAKLIARTELLRIDRAASIATYQQSTVVSGYRWYASLDSRTCLVCWSQHGKLFPVTEPMVSHPACRCTTIPELRDVGGTSFTDGETLFKKLAEDEQRRVLGPSRLEMWKANKGTTLDSFVEWDDTPYGRAPRQAPIARLDSSVRGL